MDYFLVKIVRAKLRTQHFGTNSELYKSWQTADILFASFQISTNQRTTFCAWHNPRIQWQSLISPHLPRVRLLANQTAYTTISLFLAQSVISWSHHRSYGVLFHKADNGNGTHQITHISKHDVKRNKKCFRPSIYKCVQPNPGFGL